MEKVEPAKGKKGPAHICKFLSSVWSCNNITPHLLYKPWHGISNNVVCATSKALDQPAHTRSLIRAFNSRLRVL